MIKKATIANIAGAVASPTARSHHCGSFLGNIRLTDRNLFDRTSLPQPARCGELDDLSIYVDEKLSRYATDLFVWARSNNAPEARRCGRTDGVVNRYRRREGKTNRGECARG
jgi:hypothetical protein